jgi:hypothetical protein
MPERRREKEGEKISTQTQLSGEAHHLYKHTYDVMRVTNFCFCFLRLERAFILINYNHQIHLAFRHEEEESTEDKEEERWLVGGSHLLCTCSSVVLLLIPFLNPTPLLEQDAMYYKI